MGKKKNTSRLLEVPSGLRFKSVEQQELIRQAASVADTSMNSFIRMAAEKAARAVLSESSPKDHSHAQD